MEILWQCSPATCNLILFSKNHQRWSTNSRSHWSFRHCSRVSRHTWYMDK
ncbi:hypothetical protein ACB092_12G020200 [Castanea dentata]